MTQHIRDEQLALYTAGDLAPNETSAIAAHLQDCEKCQTTVGRFREAQAFVTSALSDPTADELFEVREGIRLKIRERRSWAGWAAAAAVAVAALLITFVATKPKPAPVPQPAPLITYVPYNPIAPKLPTVVHTRHVRYRDAGIRSVDLIARADQPALIKMTTADPNVVILWQSNEGMKNE